jgi:DNA-binding response OmpR family regulator
MMTLFIIGTPTTHHEVNMGSHKLSHFKERTGNPAILLVTTSENLKMSLQKALHGMNYDLLTASNEGNALSLAAARKPAIVLVDREKHRWQTLRQHQSMQHTLMVTLQTTQNEIEKEDCISELDEGLDACWCNQSYRQIVAHLRSVFRRQLTSRSEPTALQVDGLRMDIARHEVRVNERPVELTPREFQILKQFMESPGLVLSRQDLLNRVWGVDYALEEHALDVHIHSLRHKVEPEPSKPRFILTIRGVGYKLHTT